MPFVGPATAVPRLQAVPPVSFRPAEIHWNVSPLAPIVVFATFRAVPLVVLIVLPVPWTVTVPPPVTPIPAPVVVWTTNPPPVKLIVAPVLLVRVTAARVLVSIDFD